jgi:hypothetical protein
MMLGHANIKSDIKIMFTKLTVQTLLRNTWDKQVVHFLTDSKNMPDHSELKTKNRSCKHSLVLLRMEEIIARNMLS